MNCRAEIKDKIMVDISVISGSKSDQAIVDKVASKLEEKGASFEHKVLSAHRNPQELEDYISKTDARVFIGIAANLRPCGFQRMSGTGCWTSIVRTFQARAASRLSVLSNSHSTTS